VERDVALVEAHALGELELEPEGLRLLDRDDAFLADLVHRLGDELADLRVRRRDPRRCCDLAPTDYRLRGGQQLRTHRLGGFLDALLQRHRVRASPHPGRDARRTSRRLSAAARDLA